MTAGPVDDSYLTCGTLSSKTSCNSWACPCQLLTYGHTVMQNIMWQLGLSMTVILPVSHCQTKHHVTAGPVDDSYLTCGSLSNKTSCDSWACRWQLFYLCHTAKLNIMWQLGLSMTVIWPVAHCQTKHHATVGPVDDSHQTCGTLSNKTSWECWACRWQLSSLTCDSHETVTVVVKLVTQWNGLKLLYRQWHPLHQNSYENDSR